MSLPPNMESVESRHPPSKKNDPRSQPAAWVIFLFDRFFEYPLSNSRGYSEKWPKADTGLCSFPLISEEKTDSFTKSSSFGEKWRNIRAPPPSEI